MVVDPDNPLTPGIHRWAEFANSIASSDVLRRVPGEKKIMSYETDRPDVGRTVFEGGASVTANVGLNTVGGLLPSEHNVRYPNGRTLEPV